MLRKKIVPRKRPLAGKPKAVVKNKVVECMNGALRRASAELMSGKRPSSVRKQLQGSLEACKRG